MVSYSRSTVGNAARHSEATLKRVSGTSTSSAAQINRRPAARGGARLIAETGGQNAMIVDSSALPEQVVVEGEHHVAVRVIEQVELRGLHHVAPRVALGLDAAASDPLQGLKVTGAGFHAMAGKIASLGLPTVLVAQDSGPLGRSVIAALRYHVDPRA